MPDLISRQRRNAQPALTALAAAPPQAMPAGLVVPDCALVVDDSRVQRAHAVRLLHALGVSQVLESGDGHEAQQLLASLAQPPGLMICDLVMPRSDGLELLEELSAREQRLDVIIASDCDISLLQTVESTVLSHGRMRAAAVRKPLTLEALVSVLQDWQRACPRSGGAGVQRPPVAVDELRAALDVGLVVPHFQPKVHVCTGLLRGVEALARWHDPQRGPVPPDAFVGLAEASGLIEPLTMSMLSQSLEQLARWDRQGLRAAVAVNLSPMLLEVPNLAKTVRRLCEQHQIAPQRVTLEITEGSVASQSSTALGTLARLRLDGFGLSIDDYGTGFSSLQLLSRIPFTELKVDRSFVRGCHRRHDLRIILNSALDMARQLQLLSVAEGVEDLQEWQLLRSAGCDVAQGWLIGKAMPARDLPGWLREHQLQLPALRC